MSDELIIVKAARNYADDIDNDRGIEMGLPDCLREAANLIERLTAQVDGLQDEIKRLREQVRFASETDPAMRAEAAEAEAARLKGALDQTGDAICDVLEQMVKGSWQDSMNHPVANNVAMLKLKDALVTLAQRKALAGETT